MHPIDRTFFTTLIATALVGCATPGTNTLDYTESTPINVQNEVVVGKDFEIVWRDLVRQLAKSFYVVNNIEKESRLINVSFSSSKPEDYIDCGVSKRYYERGNTSETVEYNVAANSTYRYAQGMDQAGVNAIVGTVNRETSLDGRMNIYVSPVSGGTEVSVNVRYILAITPSGYVTAVNANDQVMAREPIPQSTTTIAFSTNQPNQSDGSEENISCFSRGVLEDEILTMAVGS